MASTLDALANALRDSSSLSEASIEAQDEQLVIRRGELYVIVLPSAALMRNPSRAQSLAAADHAFLLLGRDAPPPGRLTGEAAPLLLLPHDAGSEAVCLAVDALFERLELRRNAAERIRQLSRYRYERGELVEIARAITQERDIDRLLQLILERSRYITGADAGSIYVLQGDPSQPAEQRLRFKLSQNDSMSFESSEFEMRISMESIAGAVVLTREAISIADVYALNDDAKTPYGFDESFDRRVGYRTVSMLSVPMISAEDEVIGVIQLINKKRDPTRRLETPEDFTSEVIAFDERSEELLHALSAQAGIALENAMLYAEIRAIFEGFVRASVQAIEQRDPTTSGHSVRVSVLSCALAQAVDRVDSGRFGDVGFTRKDLQELEYAALLHDFGKIGVREQVLVKAKKLYPADRHAIRQRVEYALMATEVELTRRRCELIEQGASPVELQRLLQEQEERCGRLRQAWALIERADEPTILSEGDFSRIEEVGAIEYHDLDGHARRLLTSTEVEALQVTRGTLTAQEIEEIRSHVRHTYSFLTQIPWGKSMRQIPQIAVAHHEKLNGSGYPHGLRGDAIPLSSRIMTIADIYDALTARDRPYKKALPADKAMRILGFEVEDGNLDADLVQLFRDAEVFRRTESEPV